MTTQVFVFVLETKGVKEAEKELNKVGKAANSTSPKMNALAVAVDTVVTALKVAAGVFALGATAIFGLGRASVQTARDFENYRVQLKLLLGAQSEANTAINNFRNLAKETPFAIDDIVKGATTLGSVALNNRELLEDLTLQAANIAAATGLTFEQTSTNLQRTLATGVASADLFRERGVRRLVEAILEIPDLTKRPLEEQAAAFAQVFGPGGQLGSAAEERVKTIGGVLVNVSDAFVRLREQIGEVLAPSVIAIASQIIDVFDDWTKSVRENRDELRSLIVNGIANLARAFAFVGNIIVTTLGIIEDFWEILKVLITGLNVAFTALTGPLRAISTLIAEELIGKFEDFLRVLSEAAGTVPGLDSLSKKLGKAADTAGAFREAFTFNRGEDLSRARAELEKAIADVEIGSPEAEAQLARLQARLDGVIARTIKLIEVETERRNKIESATDIALEPPPPFIPAEFGTEIGENMAKAFTDGLKDGEFPSLIEFTADSFAKKAQGRLESLFGELGGDVDRIFQKGFANLEPDRFVGPLTEAGNQSDTFIGKLSGSFQNFREALPNTLKTGAAVFGTALFGQLTRRGGESQAIDVVGESIESVEQTRGIIAGPTNIPVFKVGSEIATAFRPIEALHQTTNDLLAGILVAVGGGGVGIGDTAEPDTLTAGTSASTG